MGLTDDCKNFAESDDSKKTGNKCVVGAITTTISIIGFALKLKTFIIDLAVEIQIDAMILGQDMVRFAMESLGPWLNPALAAAPGHNVKTVTKRVDSVVKRAEDSMSAHLGVEVRHIGLWDGSMPNRDTNSNVKKRRTSTARAEGAEDGLKPDATLLPVFGMTHGGQDFHFACVGDDPATSNPIIRVGTGPGPSTEANRRRVRARALDNPVFNKQYFDQGGLDAIGRSDGADMNDRAIQPVTDADKQAAFDRLYEQHGCYLGDGLWKTDDEHPEELDAPGLWWQIYDDDSDGTLAAGAVAPFGPDGTPSIIEWTTIEACADYDWKRV